MKCEQILVKIDNIGCAPLDAHNAQNTRLTTAKQTSVFDVASTMWNASIKQPKTFDKKFFLLGTREADSIIKVPT